jgi:hypothetical protein
MFGHWLEYNAEAAEDAHPRIRAFLADHLGKVMTIGRDFSEWDNPPALPISSASISLTAVAS